MKLIYRGIQYNEENSHYLSSLVETTSKEIIYRGNSPRGRISPKFPWWQYIKQFFNKSQVRSIQDPIAFWYDRKREFLQDCWSQDEREKLNLAWDLTVQMERAKALKLKQKVKLKYRGVSYYR